MSTKKSKNKKTITQERIQSSKALLIICSLIAWFTNIAVLAVLLMNVTEWTFWICPVILLVLNTWFLISSFYSNYRFSYATRSVWFHIILVLLASISSWVLTWYLESRIVFETVALYAMPATHVLQCFAVFMTMLYARRKGKVLRRAIAVLTAASFVICAGIYGFFLATEGFFGQGFEKEHRVLVYSYDEANNYYVVEDVLDGRGGTVVIPEEFNGLPVGGINCELFENTEIKNISLNCATNVTFKNVEALTGKHADLKLTAARDKIDAFRQAFFSLMNEDEDVISLANSMIPGDLATSEVYIVCQYTKEALEVSNNYILPVWIAQKNTKFDFDSYADDYDFLRYSNASNDSDLYYCYTQQNGKIFSGIVDEENGDPNGESIKKSTKITLQFDKIYRLSISEDNDTKYTIDQSLRFTETTDGIVQYKFATAKHIPEVLQDFPERSGFDLSWKVGNRNMASVESELMILDNENQDTLALSPEWTLHAPTINWLTVNGIENENSAVYGSDISMIANAESPDPSISLRYEWKKGNTVLNSTDHTNQIENLQPGDGGVYRLTVTAYSDDITSLTSQNARDATVVFVKKDLHIYWNLPTDRIYSATDKVISVSHEENDVINNDIITLNLTQYSVKNVGNYSIVAGINGDSNAKYKIVEADMTCSLVIEPCPVLVNWNIPTLEYNGRDQAPTASAQGLGSDSVPVSVSGAQKNAGNHIATATTSNKNYTLLDNTADFTINQRPISIASWDSVIFTYNGSAQGSKIKQLSNVIAGESTGLLKQITYEGHATNANSYPYTVTAILPVDGNYCFNGPDTTTFTINPASLEISINDMRQTYTGTVFTEFSFSEEGLMGNDTLDEVLTLNFKGTAIAAINVASTAYTIDADIIGGEKFDNYTVSVSPGSLQILPKRLTITLIAANKVYDGAVYPYEDFGFTHAGLVSTDRIEEVCEVQFGGAAIDAVNASSNAYPLTATTTALTKYNNYEIAIVNATLRISQAPLTVTAVGGSKVYDGTVGSGFSITVSGLKGTDTVEMLGTPSYSGTATTNSNAGSYVLLVGFSSNATIRNYNVTYVNGTYEITPKPLTVTAVGTTKTYDGIAGGSFSITATGLATSDSISMLGTPTYDGAATTNRNVGQHELTVSLPTNTTTRNYTITYVAGELTITPKTVTVSVGANTKVYDGVAGGNFTFTVNGMVSSDTVAVFGTPYYFGSATTARDVGIYDLSVVLSGNENYTITSYEAGTLEITSKEISVRPTGVTRVYDGITTGGTFDFVVTGLAASDSKTLLGTPIYSGDALTAKNAGNYALNVQLPDYTGSNYTVTCLPGSFEITKKALTVSAVADSKVYDGSICTTFDYEVSGLVDGETKAMLGQPTYSGTAVTAFNVGSYTLKVRLQNNSVLNNYAISYVDATFTITPKDLTVKAVATDRVYNGTTGGTFSVEMIGLVSGDSMAEFGTPIYGGSAVTAKNAGTYTLTVKLPASVLASNYNITYIPDENFVISPA